MSPLSFLSLADALERKERALSVVVAVAVAVAREELPQVVFRWRRLCRVKSRLIMHHKY
jgi:hypothetical protein